MDSCLGIGMSADSSRIQEECYIASEAARWHADIPLTKPVAGVRVALLPDQGFVVNPSLEQLAGSRLDLIMAGTSDAVLMIEGFADFLTNAEMVEVRRQTFAQLVSKRVERTCTLLMKSSSGCDGCIMLPMSSFLAKSCGYIAASVEQSIRACVPHRLSELGADHEIYSICMIGTASRLRDLMHPIQTANCMHVLSGSTYARKDLNTGVNTHLLQAQFVVLHSSVCNTITALPHPPTFISHGYKEQM